MMVHQITVSPLIVAFALLLIVTPIQGIQPHDASSIIAAAAAKHDAGPQPTHSGYLEISSKPGSSLYYAFWDASNKTAASSGDQPILLWLQGGPGCASTFGAFYELGPWVTDERGKLMQNPFSFNNNFGLLIIDQPIGELHARSMCCWGVVWQLPWVRLVLQQPPLAQHVTRHQLSHMHPSTCSTCLPPPHLPTHHTWQTPHAHPFPPPCLCCVPACLCACSCRHWLQHSRQPGVHPPGHDWHGPGPVRGPVEVLPRPQGAAAAAPVHHGRELRRCGWASLREGRLREGREV